MVHWLSIRDGKFKTGSLPPDSAELAPFVVRVSALHRAVAAVPQDHATRFWLRVLESISAYSRQVWMQTADRTRKNWLPYWNLRDEHGAKNLL